MTKGVGEQDESQVVHDEQLSLMDVDALRGIQSPSHGGVQSVVVAAPYQMYCTGWPLRRRANATLTHGAR